MLSIGSLSPGAHRYFTDGSRADYYTQGGEPLGYWLGRGAEALALDGHVDPRHLERLFDGYGPDSQALAQNAGKPNRHSAWDLTFSAPKSVSVLWSVLDKEGRSAIEAAHRDAVAAALQFLEDEAVVTRRGRGGLAPEPARELIIAAFQHGTSRARDAQLHSHAIIINAARRADGSWGTIDGRPLFTHKMLAGALYRAELARGLEDRGLEVARKGRGLFGIEGVPDSLIREHSKRSEQIREDMRRRGTAGAKAAAAAALKTRPPKTHAPRGELLKEWASLAAAHGFAGEVVRRLFRGKPIARDASAGLRDALADATTAISEQKSVFTEREFLTKLAGQAPGRGLGTSAVLRDGREYLDTSKDLVRLGRTRGEHGAELVYATRGLYELERKVLELVSASKNTKGAIVPAAEVERSIRAVEKARGYSLSAEQRNAVEHLTRGEGTMRVLEGLAGTGKTALLDATRQAFASQGYRVIGAALSGKAARGLEEEAGIRSVTIAKLLHELDKPERATRRDIAKKRFSTVKGALKYAEMVTASRRKARKHFALSPKTVLVVDEAGMVGTPDMLRLMEKAKAAGASIVWTGDSRQLQPVDAFGGGFRAAGDVLGRAELKEIQRQEQDWQRKAVRWFSEGDARQALREFAVRGLVHVAEDRAGAVQQLVKEWAWNGGVKRPAEHLILTGTREEAWHLNQIAQAARRDAGDLGRRAVLVNAERIHEHDRVMFTENSKSVGVENGTFGTVERVGRDRTTLSVRLDSGKKVRVNVEEYSGVYLGYAATSHKLQGATVDNAYVLAGGRMQDQPISYVQASRARKETRFYTDEREAGDGLSELARQMGRDRQKKFIHDTEHWDEDMERLRTPGRTREKE